jgi:hypothetical protein
VILGAGVYAMMAEANQGPNLYANNIFVGGGIGVYSSRADACVHNLFVNTPQTWVNQDYGGRLPVDDARWVNNVFMSDGLNSSLGPADNRYNRNVFLDGAIPHPEDADPVIGNTPTDIQVLETSQGVALSFHVDEATLSAGYPLVDNESLELNFEIDATVDADFFAEQRSELSNSPGPFATLQPGRNEFAIYDYPSLYLKAMCLLRRLQRLHGRRLQSGCRLRVHAGGRRQRVRREQRVCSGAVRGRNLHVDARRQRHALHRRHMSGRCLHVVHARLRVPRSGKPGRLGR